MVTGMNAMGMHRIVLGLVLALQALALVAGGPAMAQTPRKAGHYVLALSWQPQFCQTHRGHHECAFRPGRYDAANLSLHGLWPQPRGVEYCGVSADDRQADETRAWERLPDVRLPPALRNELGMVMPGLSSRLDRHEWIRHGTCSGMSQDEYFRTAVDLARAAAGLALNRLISSNAGGRITVGALCAAASRDFGDHAGGAVTVQSAGGALSGITIALRARADGSVVLAPEQLERGGGNLSCGRGSDTRSLVIDAAGF
jgi:ribonuclease T2